MNTVYIIGNGFDLFHELKTSYNNDFMPYCKTYKKKELEFLKEYNVIDEEAIHDANFWSKFEESLGEVDFSDIQENFSDDYESVKGMFSFLEDSIKYIQSMFYDWIDTIVVKSKRMLSLDKNAYYINFNYTKTLETIYDISKNNILYIHADNSKYIFGHNKSSPNEQLLTAVHEGYEKMRRSEFEARQVADMYFEKLKKPVDSIILNLKKNKLLTRCLKKADRLLVLGHSINSIDFPYFKYFLSILSENTEIIVSYHEPWEKKKFAELFNDIKHEICFKKITEI